MDECKPLSSDDSDSDSDSGDEKKNLKKAEPKKPPEKDPFLISDDEVATDGWCSPRHQPRIEPSHLELKDIL